MYAPGLASTQPVVDMGSMCLSRFLKFLIDYPAHMLVSAADWGYLPHLDKFRFGQFKGTVHHCFTFVAGHDRLTTASGIGVPGSTGEKSRLHSFRHHPRGEPS